MAILVRFSNNIGQHFISTLLLLRLYKWWPFTSISSESFITQTRFDAQINAQPYIHMLQHIIFHILFFIWARELPLMDLLNLPWISSFVFAVNLSIHWLSIILYLIIILYIYLKPTESPTLGFLNAKPCILFILNYVWAYLLADKKKSNWLDINSLLNNLNKYFSINQLAYTYKFQFHPKIMLSRVSH